MKRTTRTKNGEANTDKKIKSLDSAAVQDFQVEEKIEKREKSSFTEFGDFSAWLPKYFTRIPKLVSVSHVSPRVQEPLRAMSAFDSFMDFCCGFERVNVGSCSLCEGTHSLCVGFAVTMGTTTGYP